MNEDFYIAFLTGWFILFIFWLFILIFIYVRKPLKSKLTNKIILYSILVFFFILLLLYVFGSPDSFLN